MEVAMMLLSLRVLATAAVTALIAAAPTHARAAAKPAPPAQQLRGTLVKIDSRALTLKPAGDGKPVTVALPAHAKILSVSRASLADIKPGSYIGTAATPRPDGTLKALEVHIFAPSLRGSGEGFRPWQGVGGATGTMTNGTVGGLNKSIVGDMVNGTVGGASDGQGVGATLLVKYRGGQQTVLVSPDVPVVYMEPGNRRLLKRGAAVVVFASRGEKGEYVARTVVAGKDGIVPPM
jgi:hypothetical protein